MSDLSLTHFRSQPSAATDGTRLDFHLTAFNSLNANQVGVKYSHASIPPRVTKLENCESEQQLYTTEGHEVREL
jgi:hypothetical protein